MDEEKAKILSVAGLREARNRLGICHAARQRWLISRRLYSERLLAQLSLMS